MTTMFGPAASPAPPRPVLGSLIEGPPRPSNEPESCFAGDGNNSFSSSPPFSSLSFLRLRLNRGDDIDETACGSVAV